MNPPKGRQALDCASPLALFNWVQWTAAVQDAIATAHPAPRFMIAMHAQKRKESLHERALPLPALSSSEGREGRVRRAARQPFNPLISALDSQHLQGDKVDMFQTPVLTRNRVRLAYTVAITADLLQFVLGPLGWASPDQIIDIVAMFLTWRAIGFHPLLLPTFALEFLPVVDMLPTWTACVALVISLRKKQRTTQTPPDPVIDV